DDPAAMARIDVCAALDARIHLLRHEQNQGTYAARNTALSVAQGEFVTGQDADDWSHPRRIERQISSLQDDPEVVACQCAGLCVSPLILLASAGREVTSPAVAASL